MSTTAFICAEPEGDALEPSLQPLLDQGQSLLLLSTSPRNSSLNSFSHYYTESLKWIFVGGKGELVSLLSKAE